jgi:hypothetical protein
VVIVTGLVLLVVSLAGLLAVTRTSPLVVLEVSLFAAGLGMGLTMGATTTLVMSVVPPGKAGVGSAVNNTLRQVGAALGVAAMGSVLAARYRDLVLPELAALPAGVRDQAAESLGATALVLERARPVLGEQPYVAGLRAARDSFVEAMHATLWLGIAVLVLCAVVAALWAPDRQDAAAQTEATADPDGEPPGDGSARPFGSTSRATVEDVNT